MSFDDGPSFAVVFSHPPQGKTMARRFLAAMHALLADPVETVHFHAAEGQPAVCYDRDCTIPRLDVD
jgi:hypothetical protein